MLIPASEVEVGQTLTNLGNGYVAEVLPADDAISILDMLAANRIKIIKD